MEIFYYFWVVEVVTWHTFLGHTSPRCSLIFIAWIFQLHLASFDLLGERPHLFDLAHILFYLRWLWRAFIGRHVAYLEGHMCGFCMLLLGLLSIFGDSSWRVHMWKFLLAIFGDCLGGRTCGEMFYFLFWELTTSFLVECSIYLASCTFIHGVGCLGIHTCGLVACILWTSCYFWRRLLWSILLGGLLYVLFSHASWRVHLVSSPRWTLEHILLCGELFYYILHACILGGHIPCGHLAFDLVWCLFLVVHPLS
jgi:hypothetical protein